MRIIEANFEHLSTLLWLFLIIQHLIRVICIKDRFVFSSREIFPMQPHQINFKRDKICFRKNIGFILNHEALKEVADHRPPFSRVKQAIMIIIFHRIITIVLFGTSGYLLSVFVKHFLTYQLHCTPKQQQQQENLLCELIFNK